MTTGMMAMPSDDSTRHASSTEVMGSRSMPAVMAPMPMPTAGTSGSPGRCDSNAPTTAPMKIAGKVGPPRKPLIDTP